ncbi:MAG: tryptophan synthase subunit alpha [Myxococcota bacterium]
MNPLSLAVDRANASGRLALMVYAIPRFPDPERYRSLLEYLNAREEVSILETTFPVSTEFSPYANETIREAHRQASRYVDSQHLGALLDGLAKPTVLVLYEQTLRELGYSALFALLGGTIDGLLYEWITPDAHTMGGQCSEHGMELIQCVDPGMSDHELQQALDRTAPDPLIYFVSAAKTGAPLYEVANLQPCLERVKGLRPDARVVAGFGIRTPQDVATLARLEGLDGVIIGTAFIEACRDGVEGAAGFLDQIYPALERSVTR